LSRGGRARPPATREILEGVRSHGLGMEAAVLIGNNLYQKFDSVKKTRLLRKNQGEIAGLELPPWDASAASASAAAGDLAATGLHLA